MFRMASHGIGVIEIITVGSLIMYAGNATIKHFKGNRYLESSETVCLAKGECGTYNRWVGSEAYKNANDKKWYQFGGQK